MPSATRRNQYIGGLLGVDAIYMQWLLARTTPALSIQAIADILGTTPVALQNQLTNAPTPYPLLTNWTDIDRGPYPYGGPVGSFPPLYASLPNPSPCPYWGLACIPYPGGRGGFTYGPPIYVLADQS